MQTAADWTLYLLTIPTRIAVVHIEMTKSITRWQEGLYVLWLFKSVSLHFLRMPERVSLILQFPLALNRQEIQTNSHREILNKAKIG